MKYYIRKGLYLLMAILCVGWVQAQTATTVYVSADGNDVSGAGTKDSPFNTINHALNRVQDNGTIIINYSEKAYVLKATTFPHNVTFKGNPENKEQPTIDLGNESYDTNGKDIAFDNLAFTVGGKDYKGFQHGNSETFTNCSISGTMWTYATSSTFKNCKFSADANAGNVYLLRVYGSQNVTIENCTFKGEQSGKAVLVYNETKEFKYNVQITDCQFTAGVSKNDKAAVEIHSEKGNVGIVTITNSKADGFGTDTNGLWNEVHNDDSNPYPTHNFAITVDGKVVNGLQKAIEYAEDATLQLAAKTFELSSQLVLNKPITIEGAANADGTPATTLKRTAAWSGTDNSSKHMVCVTASEATVSNLIIDGNNLTSGMATGLYEGSGIQVYENNTNVNLNNITVKNMLAAGLVVNSAKVTLTNFHTEGNLWGGVNVDKKATNDPELTVGEGCSFAEINKIWDESKVDNAISFTTTGKWTKTTLNNVDYWTNSWLSVGAKQKFNITSGELTPVYANGHAVTISNAGEGKVKIAADEDETDYLVLDEGSKVIVFGGSRDKAITGNTSVKMVSGTVNSILGGGYGLTEAASADVSGTTNVTIEGGNVAIHVYSGSYGFGKIENGVINISGKNTTVRRLQAGGAAVGSVELVDDYALAKNAVKNVTITINDATITEGMGTGGGFGYSYTGTSTVNVTKATLGGFYGTLSNGFANKITANLTDCTFEKKISYFEIGTINRGKVGTASFAFNNCTFPSSNEITTFTIGAIEDWGGSDTNGKPAPEILNSVSYTFTSCSNVPTVQVGEGVESATVTLTGASAILKKFRRGSQITEANGGTEKDAFTIGNSAIWTFNNGLELTSDVTLNNNGSLSVGGVCKVATDAQLATVLSADVKKIQLAEGKYKDFTINKSDVIIDGNNKAIITGTVTLDSDASGVLTGLTFTPASEKKAIISNSNYLLSASYNYWNNTNPDFNALIDGTGKVNVNPYPYYNNADMQNNHLAYQVINVSESREITEKIYPGCNLEITSTGHATLTQTNAKFGSVIIYEGGQLTPPTYNAEETGRAIADRFVFNPKLENKWKALGTPFAAELQNKDGQKVQLSAKEAETGIWFAGLVDGKPEIEVKKTYTNAGLWAANDKINYGLHAQNVTLESKAEPAAPTSGLQMFVNPNTYNITLKQSAYVLNDAGTVFELKDTPTIKAFQSFVLADRNTTATLRSIGTTDPNATGNEFVVKEGYYLTTERGAIVVHTAEPMELYVVAVSGAVVYRGTVADGQRIAVPTGFYAVNGQMVRVK